MSTTAYPKLLTAEEFFLLPDPQDGSQQELVRGEIVTIPPPGGLHGVTCSKVNRKLGAFIDAAGAGTLVCNDTGFVHYRTQPRQRSRPRHFFERIASLTDRAAQVREHSPILLGASPASKRRFPTFGFRGKRAGTRCLCAVG